MEPRDVMILEAFENVKRRYEQQIGTLSTREAKLGYSIDNQIYAFNQLHKAYVTLAHMASQIEVDG